MRTKLLVLTTWKLLALAASAVGLETHWALQTVDENGVGTHPALFTNEKVSVEGILLTSPELYLDGAPNSNQIPYNLGGQWQIYFQGEGDDHAGTAVWMGQCYGNLPFGTGRYSDAQWEQELYRLNHDPNTGYAFRPGDRIRVTGLLKYHNGKTNINERHSTDPDNNVIIELVKPAVGLPQPELVDITELKDEQDNYIFDATRESGGEYYQSRLIRIDGVQFADVSRWGPRGTMTITAQGRTLPVRLGLGGGFLSLPTLEETFDIIGILDQEGGGTLGYRLLVGDYDGNPLVLDYRNATGRRLRSDADDNYRVDINDLAVLASEWLQSVTGMTP